jgi:hypothetical protein
MVGQGGGLHRGWVWSGGVEWWGGVVGWSGGVGKGGVKVHTDYAGLDAHTTYHTPHKHTAHKHTIP